MFYRKSLFLSIAILIISTVCFILVNSFENPKASEHIWTWWMFRIIITGSLFIVVMLPATRFIAHHCGYGQESMTVKSFDKNQVVDNWHGEKPKQE